MQAQKETRGRGFGGQRRRGFALGRLWVWLIGGLLYANATGTNIAGAAEPTVLARVIPPLQGRAPNLPVHAWLQDADGRDYWLVIAEESRLLAAGADFEVLVQDPNPRDFVLVRPGRPDDPTALDRQYPVLLDDGRRRLLRANEEQTEDLVAQGYRVQRLRQSPILRRTAGSAPGAPPLMRQRLDSFAPDPLLADLLARVDPADLRTLLRRLSGEEPVVTDRQPNTLSTRHTAATTEVARATQWAFERLHALGLETAYHAWNCAGYQGRNVVGTQRGNSLSNEVVLLTAHLDDMPRGALAPGADDNASGCVTLLTAAKMFSQCRFERTVRFVLFTGEEQGLLGSECYALDAVAAKEPIVAVINLDMLAWNGTGEPTVRLHTRTPRTPGHTNDWALATLFTNVVAAYGLSNNLAPVIQADADEGSDQLSFWSHGFTALYAEEDYPSDFNPYYHTTNDTVAHLDLAYYTAFTRAVVGTFAHLAQVAAAAPREIIEIAQSDWRPGSGLDAGVFHARREAGASATGPDPLDREWTAPTNRVSFQELKVFTQPYGSALSVDSRPLEGTAVFAATLAAFDPTGAGISGENRLRFNLLTPPQPNCAYDVRVHIDGRFTATRRDFDCATNLLAVLANGGFLALPDLSQASDGSAYGALTLTVSPAAAVSVVEGPRVTNGLFWVRLAGAPNARYALQTATVPHGPWLATTNLTASDTGSFRFTVPLDASATRFFRVLAP